MEEVRSCLNDVATVTVWHVYAQVCSFQPHHFINAPAQALLHIMSVQRDQDFQGWDWF